MVTTAVTRPPEGSTRYKPVCQSEKRIGPALLHAPPPELTGTVAMGFGESPRRSTVLSCAVCEKSDHVTCRGPEGIGRAFGARQWQQFGGVHRFEVQMRLRRFSIARHEYHVAAVGRKNAA